MRLLKQSFDWLPRRFDTPASDINQRDTFIRRRRRTIAICIIIFIIAFGARFFQWRDHGLLAAANYIAVNDYYLNNAQSLLQGDFKTFLAGPDPASDATVLTHPPGYAILVALASLVFNKPVVALQFFQIISDSLASVLIFLIAIEILPVPVGIIAGTLVGLSPQLGFYSLLLLPESLAVLPILLAVLFIVRASKQPQAVYILAAGAFIGLSCWLRSNALLLAPFLAIAILLLFERSKRLRSAVLLCCATVVVIAPITIRNLIIFHHFIPLSLGSGITLVEGIGDYDKENKFGLPDSDYNLMSSEAKSYNRPDYVQGIYRPDGIERERARASRGLAVIRSHPFWFLGVMLRRAAFMLEPDQLLPDISLMPEAPAAGSIRLQNGARRVWSLSPAELIKGGIVSSHATVSLEDNGQALHLVGDWASIWTNHLVSPPMAVQKHTAYLLKIPVEFQEGRIIFSVMSPDLNTEVASVIVPSPLTVRYPKGLPPTTVQILFSSGDLDQVSFVLRDGGMGSVRANAKVGQTDLFEVGPAPKAWTSYPRAAVRSVQQVLMVSWSFPLAIVGIFLLALAGRSRTIVILIAVPFYYLSIHSVLHVEHRYVLAMDYFLILIAAVPLYWLARILWQSIENFQIACLRYRSCGSQS